MRLFNMAAITTCGACYFYSEFDFFCVDDPLLQIIASIFPKASVENSSAQWAIFFIDLVVSTT